ncbi:MAG TPA: nitroreductase [Deltaproteobacteria bacterium]|nr:nitroreductase [Deltaproteobacteria bacterium]HOI05847.1 nitroreductase [Deltaproteobacteria bacterium]
MRSAIRDRRSVRKFTGEPVPDELVEDVLEAGRWAPSGLNNQPWRFAVIRDRALKEELSCLTAYKAIVAGADVIIAVFFDTAAGYDRTKDLQGIGACIQNMLLAIHDLGLGGVWLGEILRSSAQVKALLGAPDSYEFMAAIALGHPQGRPPRAPGSKPLADLVFFRK